MRNHALTLRNVTKMYGSRAALDDLSCHVPAGTICGFVGPNGAGKTTTFSVVSGFIRPSAGEVGEAQRGGALAHHLRPVPQHVAV